MASKKQTKKEKKEKEEQEQKEKEEEEQQAFEFMLENTILYWLDILPVERCKLMVESIEPTVKMDWYHALNEIFKTDECPKFQTMSPTMIKYFLIDFIEEKQWQPKMGFSVLRFNKMFKKLKELKERDEEYFMTECSLL